MEGSDRPSRAANRQPPLLADCHLHFEGCLSAELLGRFARRAGHAFADSEAFEQRRRSIGDDAGFLALYADVCRLFRCPEDYGEAAGAIAGSLAADGVAYAEIYVSPAIFSRMGLDAAACLEAIDAAFRARSGGCECRILLDAVRQWGPETAEGVLDLYEEKPLPSVVGFGMGGDERAVPAAAFSGVYLRARALGLKTAVHAGEWAGPDSLEQALDSLRPDRVDHGIAAAASEDLIERLADERTTLCVAPSGNVATGAVESLAEHPLPRLIAAGVRVALSADDPLLFSTTTTNEYRRVEETFALGEEVLRRLAENSWRASFRPKRQRDAGAAALAAWTPPAARQLPDTSS